MRVQTPCNLYFSKLLSVTQKAKLNQTRHFATAQAQIERQTARWQGCKNLVRVLLGSTP